MAKPIDRKELRKPDEFVSFWMGLGQKLEARRRGLLAGGVAVALVAIGSLVVSQVRERSATSTGRDFARIGRIVNAGLLPAEGPAPKAENDTPRFKTDAERKGAALKEIESFLGAHGGSDLRDEALLLRAGFLLDIGKPVEALAVYDDLLAGKVDKRLRFLAHEGAAYAYEAKGEPDKAIAASGRLADEASAAGGLYRDRALYLKARLLEHKGDAKEATRLLHEILDKMPTTALKDDISDRLAVLESK